MSYQNKTDIAITGLPMQKVNHSIKENRIKIILFKKVIVKYIRMKDGTRNTLTS